MHDFTLFLLEKWLPVGLSAIVFFAIGLLMAKFIWGRYNQRLSFAVEENLNLASQWSSLGASQRDLFKKLRSRWQADRDAWEARISQSETELATREARIEQLSAHLKGTGKGLPAPVVIDRGSERRIEQLQARLNDKEKEIEILKAEAKESTSPGEFFARAQVTEETTGDESEEESVTLTIEQTENLQCRIQELEQDLTDIGVQFQSLREDHEKQSCLVESLKSQLIELPDESEIRALKLKLEQANHTATEASRAGEQLATLLSWKNRETVTLKRETEKLQVTAREAETLREALVETTENLEARDRELEEAKQKFEATNSELEQANHIATEVARAGEQLATLLSWKNRETVILKRATEKLQATAREAEILREALIETTETLEARDRDLEEAKQKIEATNSELEQANHIATEAARAGEQLATLLSWKNRETVTLKRETEKLQVTAREAEILREALIETTETLEARGRDLEEANQRIEVTNYELEQANHTAMEAARAGEQLATLLSWKNRETVILKREAEKLQVTAREAEILREALIETTETLEARDWELEKANQRIKAISSELEREKNQSGKKSEEITQLSTTIKTTESEIASKTATIGSLESEVAKLTEAVSVIEPLKQSKAALQAELNDACHEVHEVRTALNERMGEIDSLKSRLNELGEVEEERIRLDAALLESRHDFANLRLRFEETQNDLKISTGQMEELEAIIEDRSAEVDDLSAEVRQQRDLIQEQKQELARKEGEIEAASGQVSTLSVQVTSKEKSLKNKADRIEDLERALTERYEEMNSVRMEYDEELKSARYHAARASQLEAELDRRAAAFDETNLRAVTSEEALERADQRIEELTSKLVREDEAITALKRELEELSEEKQEYIRNIKEASERAGRLESAVQNREQELEAIGDELKQVKASAEADKRADAESIEKLTSKHADSINQLISQHKSAMAELKHKGETEISRLKGESKDLNRHTAVLGTDLAAAKEEQAASEALIAELKSALNTSDERTVTLSKSIDDIERELVALNDDLIASNKKAANRKAKLAKVKQAAEKTQVELDAKLERVIKDKETIVGAHEAMLAERFEEIEELRANLAEQEQSTDLLKKQRSQNIEEVEKFRNKVAKRGEIIRELQAEISNIMLQRSSRDDEIDLLKEKLRALEQRFRSTDGVQSLATLDTANINSIEDSVQNSPCPQVAKKGDEVALDEIEASIESGNQCESPAESPDEQLEPETELSVTNDDSIFFDESSSDLTENGLNAIDRFARVLRESNRNLTVAVVGYSGPEGSPDYTDLLSARRADAVRERLLERGVPQSIISVKSSGQDRCCNNWRARRVELLQIISPEAEAVN